MRNAHLLTKDDKTYVSGGMTGYAEFNYPMFDNYSKQLRERGIEIFNPASDIKPMTADGKKYEIVEFHKLGLPVDKEWEGFLRGDIIAIMNQCNAMYMIRGWLASKGAKLELYVAKKFGYKIVYERPFIVELIAAGLILFCQKVLKIKLKKPF